MNYEDTSLHMTIWHWQRSQCMLQSVTWTGISLESTGTLISTYCEWAKLTCSLPLDESDSVNMGGLPSNTMKNKHWLMHRLMKLSLGHRQRGQENRPHLGRSYPARLSFRECHAHLAFTQIQQDVATNCQETLRQMMKWNGSSAGTYHSIMSRFIHCQKRWSGVVIISIVDEIINESSISSITQWKYSQASYRTISEVDVKIEYQG